MNLSKPEVGAYANVYVSPHAITRIGKWKASREDCIKSANGTLPPGLNVTLMCRVRIKTLKTDT